MANKTAKEKVVVGGAPYKCVIDHDVRVLAY